MKKGINIVAISLILLAASCKNADKPAQEEVIINPNELYSPKDSNIIKAYTGDKSTITAADIDLKDTSYSSRTKFLYKSAETNEDLAVVYGFKKDGSLGIAIVQKNNGKPFTLTEKKSTGINKAEYSDGKITLIRNQKEVTLMENNQSTSFAEIQ